MQPSHRQVLSTLSLTGISRSYSRENVDAIPDQWQQFASVLPHISPQAEPVTYGVIYSSAADCFEYLSGVEGSADTRIDANLVCLTLAARTYLVFKHREHVSTLRETCDAIWSDASSTSRLEFVDAPWFERYGEQFNPTTGLGGVEIWIPVND